MEVSRRNWIAAAGLASAAGSRLATAASGLPDKNQFPVVGSEVCLNNARWHPISRGATRAVQQYLDYKASGGGADPDYGGRLQTRVKEQFARLIHAKPDEVSFCSEHHGRRESRRSGARRCALRRQRGDRCAAL